MKTSCDEEPVKHTICETIKNLHSKITKQRPVLSCHEIESILSRPPTKPQDQEATDTKPEKPCCCVM